MVFKLPFLRSPASDVHMTGGTKPDAPAEPATESQSGISQSASPNILPGGRSVAGNSATIQPHKVDGLRSYVGDDDDYGDDDDDDDDDDLDELDDILDEFNAGSSSKSAKNLHGETSTQGASLNQPSLNSLDDDFARQLQQGMADLLKEMEESPEFQAQFDSLVQELDKSAGPVPNQADNGKGPVPAPDATSVQLEVDEDVAQGASSFHDTIAKTMERMKESGAEIDTEMADSQSDDFLAEMLRQMQMATGRGGSDEDFSKMLMGMMEQLTNKEILYEPMKELNEKFPGWLVENEGKHSVEEMDNFREQARLVREIVAKFEQPSFSDSSDMDREYIVERMQKMQAVGSPPAELLGDMGQGDGLPPDIENCPVQ
ncbi:Peroxisome chaperone and import receptor [Orbilia blumenaviensis]|uniref:Peroxisome chaperone and import receptor n=1 Tax=Orbilia blumenaviensis TaxID=1796055 RepID=A0AAV9U5W0_9PEZI